MGHSLQSRIFGGLEELMRGCGASRTIKQKLPFLVSLYKAVKQVSAYAGFVVEYLNFKKLSVDDSRFVTRWKDRYPCLKEKTATLGFDRHYVFHTAWAARILAQTRPEYHVDISSSLDFVAVVSAFVPVRFYDYRSAQLHLSTLSSEAGDLLALPFATGSVSSLSCMSVVEHVGLGRYGDPLDPYGDLKAMAELRRVVAPGGSLLYVVPVGKPLIMYNAHRIYSYEQVAAAFPDFELVEFSLIPDLAETGGLMIDAAPQLVVRQDFGCGCFWLRKKTGA